MRRRIERQAADLFAEVDGHAGRTTLPAVASIAQERAKRLRDWMSARGIYPSSGTSALSGGTYSEFEDFPNLMNVIEHVWLGGGEKAKKHLGVCGTPTDRRAEVQIDGATLSFEDLALKSCE